MQYKPKSTPFDVLIGNNLRHIRVMKNVSQSELADALGVTFQQIQKYEKGTNRISATRLFVASQFLQVNLESFFNGQDFCEVTDKINIYNLDKQTLEFISLFLKIDCDNLKKNLLNMLKNL